MSASTPARSAVALRVGALGEAEAMSFAAGNTRSSAQLLRRISRGSIPTMIRRITWSNLIVIACMTPLVQSGCVHNKQVSEEPIKACAGRIAGTVHPRDDIRPPNDHPDVYGGIPIIGTPFGTPCEGDPE